jgi:hypothetical protein
MNTELKKLTVKKLLDNQKWLLEQLSSKIDKEELKRRDITPVKINLK